MAEADLMGFRGTLVLFVLVVLLGGLYWWLGDEAPVSEDLSVPVLEGHSLAEATRMEVHWQGEAPLEFARQPDGTWWLVEPIRDRMSTARLRSIGEAYGRMRMQPAYRGDEVAPEILEDTGLAEPRATFRVEFRSDGEGGPETVVTKLGVEAPGGEHVYLLRDGVVHRGSLALRTAIRLNVDESRERQMIATTVEEAQVVHVDHHGRELRLERTGAGPWRMTAPIESRVEVGAVRGFLAEVLSLRADRFLGTIHTPAEEPTVEIVVEGQRGRETVSLWEVDGGGVVGLAEGRDAAFSVAGSEFTRIFERAAGALRARWLVPFSTEELTTLKIDRGDDDFLVLRRQGQLGFQMVHPCEVATDPTATNEALSAVRRLQAADFVAGPPRARRFGLDGGFLTVTLHGVDEREPTVLFLGADEGEYTYGRRRDEDQVVLVPKEAADALRRPWTVYVGKQVLDVVVPPQSLLLSWRETREAGGRVERRFHLDEGRWLQAGRDERMGPRFVEFVAALRDLRAARAIERDELGPGLEVRVRLAREVVEDVLAELVVHVPEPDAGEGPVYAWLAARPRPVYELPYRESVDVRWLLQRD